MPRGKSQPRPRVVVRLPPYEIRRFSGPVENDESSHYPTTTDDESSYYPSTPNDESSPPLALSDDDSSWANPWDCGKRPAGKRLPQTVVFSLISEDETDNVSDDEPYAKITPFSPIPSIAPSVEDNFLPPTPPLPFEILADLTEEGDPMTFLGSGEYLNPYRLDVYYDLFPDTPICFRSQTAVNN